jgi:hypothetical protein
MEQEFRSVIGRICSDYSGNVRHMAGCNYSSNDSRVLIIVAIVAAQLN